MNIYKLFRGRVLMRRNPTFGSRYYINAHRYVYYVDKKPRYYFSDRPYTLEDAKNWKSRGIICYLIMSLCFMFVPAGGKQFFADPEMTLVWIACMGIMFWSIAMTVLFLMMNPEKDPMLVSFPCTSDLERPQEDTCKYCSGIYSHGAHTVCPHCNAQIVP